jgi:hypothetical protein
MDTRNRYTFPPREPRLGTDRCIAFVMKGANHAARLRPIPRQLLTTQSANSPALSSSFPIRPVPSNS